ncbi:hypothetical protein C8F01DRAFT_769208 [Mycena amicta]|nr:hypothetical protein C8F01DRAFT_769208 [Mycena amicta]
MVRRAISAAAVRPPSEESTGGESTGERESPLSRASGSCVVRAPGTPVPVAGASEAEWGASLGSPRRQRSWLSVASRPRATKARSCGWGRVDTGRGPCHARSGVQLLPQEAMRRTEVPCCIRAYPVLALEALREDARRRLSRLEADAASAGHREPHSTRRARGPRKREKAGASERQPRAHRRAWEGGEEVQGPHCDLHQLWLRWLGAHGLAAHKGQSGHAEQTGAHGPAAESP